MKINIFRVNDVTQHPENENWTIVHFGFEAQQYSVISSKCEDGSLRYNIGDWILYCPTNAIIPEFMLKHGYWDEEKNKGCLGGNKGNRVKPFKGSTGIIFPFIFQIENYGIVEMWCCDRHIMTIAQTYFDVFTTSQFDFAPSLAIGEYIPQ